MNVFQRLFGDRPNSQLPLLLPQTPQISSKAKSWYEWGSTLYRLGHWERAIASYDRSLTVQPDYGTAWQEKGLALAQLERYDEAIAAWDKANQFQASSPQAWYERGEVLAQANRSEEALESYDKALEMRPGDEMGWLRKGDLLCQLQRYEEALESYDKALEIKEDWPMGWSKRGVVLLHLNRTEEALKSYDRVIAVDESAPESWRNRGWLLSQMGRYQEALQSYDRALDLQQNSASLWQDRGEVLSLMQRYGEAIAAYDRALSLQPQNDQSLLKKGDALVQVKRYKEAIAIYDGLLDFKPNNEEAWGGKGTALNGLEQYDEAIAACDRALSLNPQDWEIWLQRSNAAFHSPGAIASLPVEIAPYPSNSDLHKPGYPGARAALEEGLKHCDRAGNPEGWGELQRAIGHLHIERGNQTKDPLGDWCNAILRYNDALSVLTPETFPEAHRATLKDFIEVCRALSESDAAKKLLGDNAYLLDRLLDPVPLGEQTSTLSQQLAMAVQGQFSEKEKAGGSKILEKRDRVHLEPEKGDTEVGDTEVSDTEVGDTEVGDTEVGDTNLAEISPIDETLEAQILSPKESQFDGGNKYIFYIALGLGTVSLCLGIVGSLLFWSERRDKLNEGQLNAKREALWASFEIEQELRLAQKNALDLSNLFSSGQLGDASIPELLQQNLKKIPNLARLGVAYQPFAYSPDLRLHAPIAIHVEDEVKFLEGEKLDFNYILPQYPWYRETLNEGPNWGEPYAGPEETPLSELAIGFYTPFSRIVAGQATPRGVIFAEYSLNQLKAVVNNLDIGKTGYGFLVSDSGVFLSHPNGDLIDGKTNLLDLARAQDNPEFLALVEKGLKGEQVEGNFTDEITGQRAWLLLQPISLNGWAVGVVFLEEELLPDSNTVRQKTIGIALAFAIFLILGSVVFLRVDKGEKKNLWASSIFASVILIAKIGLVWNLALANRNYVSSRNLLLSQTEVTKAVAEPIKTAIQAGKDAPVQIPTGIFLQSIDFRSANEVFVTGYIWQKYSKDIDPNIARGFIFPDAVDSNDVEIREEYRYEQDDKEIIGWYFETSLRQNFQFNSYPFDSKDITLRLWPSEWNETVILTPDLASYEVINPRSTPGLDTDLDLVGWNIQDSFFEYRLRTYNSNFGYDGVNIGVGIPELYFTVVAKRAFIGPFVSKIGPQFVVISLLFAMLLISDRDKAMEILAACAGFIFIVILDQISVRDQIVSKGLIYFEYFYLIIYLFIFLVSINAILLLVKPDFALIRYQDNLVSKVSFWPSLLGLLLLVTIFVFY
ncbi:MULTISPECIES: tetratricopeptide repeat protein [Spirulina sp. CCY15215]|uniref:tetratricopeptide repeat protein n=1 Tax=Spirulina sp. CCY15215 TaxID=2767591 RepID=UPI00194DCF62|nr:tetratricopeptide repeat protein [Spirulina major]